MQSIPVSAFAWFTCRSAPLAFGITTQRSSVANTVSFSP